MIPRRIALKGFLCYRDEQVVSFEDASLWLLTGGNGSGKSAIFDAVTYALFGGHRAGLTGAQALINKDSKSLAVEFDFLLDNQLYQARRTLRLNVKGTVAGTQQIRRATGGDWEALPDTSTRVGFDRWVRENIGLTYETFTSSVLLMQGQAEKLLAATPKDRFEVLAGIVGLDSYQKLHKQADDRRRTLQAEVEVFQHQLNGLAEVTDIELEEVEQQLRVAQAALTRAQDEKRAVHELQADAEHWIQLQDRLRAAQAEMDEAQQRLREADCIDRDAARWRELRALLPYLEVALEQRDRLRQSELTSGRLIAEQGRLAIELEVLGHSLNQTRQKQRRLEETAAMDGERLRHMTEQLRGFAAVLPLLRHFHRERTRLQQARARTTQAAHTGERAAARLERIEAAQESLRPRLASAVLLRQQSEHALTRTQTLLEAAQDRAARFLSVVGEQLCRYCGQPLTGAHARTEQQKIEEELAAARAAYEEAGQINHANTERAARLQERAPILEEQGKRAQERVADCRHACAEGRREAKHSQEECGQTWRELPEPFRSHISTVEPDDWLTTIYPSDVDLTDIHQDQQRTQAGLDALRTEADVHLVQLTATQQERLRLEDESAGIHRRLAENERQQEGERIRREAGTEILARARAELPGDWQERLADITVADLENWQQEFSRLDRANVEARARELQQQRSDLEALARRIQDLETEQQTIPAAARCAPARFEEPLAQTGQAIAAQEEAVRAARHAQSRLLDRRSQREQLGAKLLALDRQHHLHRLLAELLGRNRLQLYLVRQAERAIVAHANTILDRLSAGQLYLQLRGEQDEEGKADQALQLEAYNRTAGQAPIPVSFLSGSQRFRVAVSLALGIGQYASRQHRPIESVIIDEGFGCLDRQGRQVMIQELQNLKDHLRCILLVSHQEEFADAFPDGYRFEIVNGTTLATRFPP